MKVLQMVPAMKMGGVETGTFDLAGALVRQGYESYVMSCGGALAERLGESGVRHIERDVHRKSLLSILRLIPQVRKIILDERIDIVHARSRVPAWIGYYAVRGTPARFVTTAHGYYTPHPGSRVMARGERVIAVSNAIRDHLVADFHVEPSRVRVIYRGVNLDEFPFSPKPISGEGVRIGILGRLTPLKGHEDFLRAMRNVSDVFPGARGLVIGDADASRMPYRAKLLRLRDELNLSQSVDFLPASPNVARILDGLDILVLATTVPEAFGRVLIEAQAAGVAVVGTRVGGVTDIIEDGVTGRLTQPGDPAGLARVLIELISDPSRLPPMIQAARKRVEQQFSLDRMVDSTLQVYEELLRSPRILIVKLSALGDIILSSPAVRTLREAYPQAQIRVLTSDKYLPLFRHCPYVDGTITYDTSPSRRFLRLLRLVREIRCWRFDRIIDLQNNRKSHWAAFGSRVPDRVGFSRGLRFFMLTKRLPYRSDAGPVQSQNRLLGLIGLHIGDPALELWPGPVSSAQASGILADQGVNGREILVALFPFSSARWESKRWESSRYLELAQRLAQELHVVPVFVGGAEDAAFSRTLKIRCNFRYVDLIGKTDILTLSEILRRCRAFVGGDSAPLHVAAAAGIPVVALFGPTDPARHKPPGRVAVLTHPVGCAPCYSPVCKIKTHECLDRITVEDVLQKVKAVLR